MQVQDVMTRTVTTLTPQATVREAATCMREDNIGIIPIVEEGKILGMVTDRDLVVRALADKRATGNLEVRKVMSEGAYAVHAGDDIGEAAETMARHQVHRVPVLDDNEKLVGIVSLGDLGRQAPDAGKEALEGISEINEQPRR